MATKFTSKEFKKSLYQAAGGSHIRKGEMMKAMKKVGAGKPLYGNVSKERVFKTLKQMKAKGILSGFQQRQAKSSLLRQTREAQEAQKPKGPNPEELRRQEANRRRNIYEAQRTRQEELKKEGVVSAPPKGSSISQAAVPLAGSRIESVGPSSAGARNQYQGSREERPETPETGVGRNLGGQAENNPPSPGEAKDLPIIE